eukprot:1819257-Karenia_brevis.AAC.1
MLADIQYDDPGVADYLVQGVKVMGLLPKTGIWKPGGTHPTVNLEAVLRNAREAQCAMLARRSHNDIDVDVWKATMVEVEEGLLEGPFSQLEVEARLGRLWTGARRFGVVQSNK